MSLHIATDANRFLQESPENPQIHADAFIDLIINQSSGMNDLNRPLCQLQNHRGVCLLFFEIYSNKVVILLK